MTTRFNNETYRENILARRKYLINNYKNGCLYGSPTEISNNITIHSKIFVFEMNNSINKVEGIGFITNRIYYKKKYKIYNDGNYNRFIYKGKYWVSREELNDYDKEYMKKIDEFLFKGYDHMKRGHGISLFSKKKFDKIKRELFEFVRRAFIYYYS